MIVKHFIITFRPNLIKKSARKKGFPTQVNSHLTKTPQVVACLKTNFGGPEHFVKLKAFFCASTVGNREFFTLCFFKQTKTPFSCCAFATVTLFGEGIFFYPHTYVRH